MGVTFDTIITVDWSGGNQKSVKPCADAIWVSVHRDGRQDPPVYFRNRQLVESWLILVLTEERTAGRRVFVGFDFAFGYPDGFAHAVTGDPDPLALWQWYDEHIIDTPTTNNRFDIAGTLNARFDGIGPFWGNGLKRDVADLPRKGNDRTCTAYPERRAVEHKATGAFSVWQMSGAGAVGSQVMMGLPVLHRLRQHFKDQVAVWPFEAIDAPIVFVEVWPSLYADAVRANHHIHPIKDAVQVHVLTDTIASMSPDNLARTLDVPVTSEGWIFGVDP